jgi:endonuclease/exonuclease/phosphatase family metal-dependent hydrolase
MAPLLCKATQSKEVETLSQGIVANKAKSNGLDAQQPGENQPLDEYADRVVFMGDFNYRINGNRDIVDSMIRNNMHEALLSNDQLRISIRKGLAFQRYLEPPLNFKPTYKLEIDSDEYDTSKKRRIPSWTDRVLYAPKGLECVAYNADFSIRTSDHRPVYASFVAAVDIPDAMGAGAKQIEYSAPSQVCSLM